MSDRISNYMNKTVTVKNFKILPYLWGITYNPLNTFSKLIKKYGNVLQLKVGKDSVYVVNDPDVIKHILKTNQDNYPRGKSVDDLADLFGNGLLNSDEAIWQVERKALTPAFHNSQLEQFYQVFFEEARSFTTILKNYESEQKPINLEYHFKLLLMRITFRNLFSPDFNYDIPKIYDSLSLILHHTTFKESNYRLFKSIILKKKIKLFSNDRNRAALQIISETAEKLFEQAYNGEIKTGGMLTILVKSVREGITEKSTAVDELKNVIFAGSDTVANGLLWLFYFLDKNQQYLEKIVEEIKDIDDVKLADQSALRATPVVQSALKETLRLVPPVWSFYRTSLETENINGYVIPKGAFIMISPFLLHRSEKFWNNPLVFRPERFMTNEEVEQFNYIPFGQGKHICIGNRLAQIEIQLLAIYLLKRFNFEFVSPTEGLPVLKPELIIASKTKVKVRVENRTRKELTSM
ncbi:MAG: hypothetical protein SCALA702_03830 [Melioribacteraceae bacterium]|nr:MAG: hypothetical protein SCALA702_03830 [Melioribacteraceae bacterium]